jgi:8-oxo-dGTP pyrophosphatase MutT (NUDIX family)
VSPAGPDGPTDPGGHVGPATSGEPTLVRAGGGAVWRRGSAGLEVVLVHRPHYDDWTLPKGKVDSGETDEDAARREVQEEASVEVELGSELPAVHYVDHKGRPKVARYWTMTVVSGTVAADNEIDRAEWFPWARARDLLSYERDHPVLDGLAHLDRLGRLG